jgi:DHA3 family macrolide efflux protein-like MFS transporter
LRQRTFRLLWLGQVASVAGDRLYSVAVVWFTVQLTGSAAAVAVVSLADTVPFLLASLFAGAVADSRDGLGLARTVDLIRAGVVALVPILYFIGQLHLVGLAVVAAVLSSMEAFFLPALQASLPRLVEPARLTPLVALLDSTDRLGRVLGPGVVGLLAAMVPEIHLFTLDSVSFVASALCLTHLVKAARPKPEPHVATGSRTAVLTAGWRELVHRPELRHALILRGLCNLAWPAFTIGAPFVVTNRYQHGIGAYGLALGAFGLGNLVGNLLSSRVHDQHLLRWCAIAWALAGLGFLAIAGAPDYPLFLLGSTALGVCTPLANVTVDVHIAKTLPGHLLARTYAAQRFVVVAAGAAGLPIAAVLINHIGAAATIAVSGILITAVASAALLLQPRPPGAATGQS